MFGWCNKKLGGVIRSTVLLVLLVLNVVLLAFGAVPLFVSVRAQSHNYGEAFQKALWFYMYQKAGRLPSNYPIIWRASAGLKDGSDVGLDLTGGYFDAGDHVKFGLPMAYTIAQIAWAVYEYRQAFEKAGLLDLAKDIIKWGADYFVKAHPQPYVFYYQVGDGPDDHSWWIPPEIIDELTSRKAFAVTLSAPGSTVTAETAAALALAYLVLGNSTYLQHAKQLFDFAYRTQSDAGYTASMGFYPSSGFWDDIAWAGVWLYIATNDNTYLKIAEEAINRLGVIGTWTWTQCWDDVRYGAIIMLAKITGNKTYIDNVLRHFAAWIPELAKQYGTSTSVKYTPGGLAVLTDWGSLRYTAAEAFLALVWADYTTDTNLKNILINWATSQINYILGNNPLGVSFIVGYGSKWPKNPHHRGAHASWVNSLDYPEINTHTLFGALVGGPDSNDSWSDSRSDYVRNEVACDYNAGLVGALARLYLLYGGNPLSDFPQNYFKAPYENFRDEYFVRAYIISKDSRSATISIRVNNRAAWPATVKDKFSVRVFIDLSELLNAGYSTSNLRISVPYSATNSYVVKGPTQWSGTVYYIEIDLTGTKIFPAGRERCEKEIQLRLEAPVLDLTNDWSLKDLPTSIRTDPVYEDGKTPYITLYDAGRLIWGQEPSPGATTTTTTSPTTTTRTTTTTTTTSPTATPTTTTTTTTSPTTTTPRTTTTATPTVTVVTVSVIVSVPLTLPLTTPITTTVTTTVPVTLIIPVSVTTTITTTSPVTTTTSPTTTATPTTTQLHLLPLLRLLPLLTTTTTTKTTATTTSAPGVRYSFTLNAGGRVATVSNCIEFRVSGGSTTIGGVTVSSGSVLKICVNNDNALTWWIGADGWLSANDLDVSAVYVNGNQVLSNTKISLSGIQADLSTISSTLTITVTGTGWTSLTWNGQTVISGTDSRTLTISGVAPTTSKAMNLNIGTTTIYADATATNYTLQ
jgi:hypothetical protein